VTTSTTVLPPPVAQKFSAKLLSTPQARLIHSIVAMPYEMEENSGDILRMRRYTRLNTAPVPLGPAMNNPPVQTLNSVDIDARIDWYARHNWRSKTFSDFRGTLSEAA
jgi:N4-gp56 family major capsid protein